MNFINELNVYEQNKDTGFRLLKRIPIAINVELSIQASYAHYCNPRKTVSLNEYETMELAIFVDNNFVPVEQVTNNEVLIDKFNEYYEGMVYGFVPVELLEELYQELIKH
jgi:hypothetical protein